ncbi:MAG: T9SS type A sorting domain-containing protein [Cyclobacteriaceae bacterium]
MIKALANILLVIVCQFAFAQLEIKPIKRNQEAQLITEVKDISPGSLPFWDDFSVTREAPDSLRVWGADTTLQWDPQLSRGVFINATLAINPPTYNAATFDGLDSDGNVYVADDAAKDLADILVSTSIDLSGKTEGDDIYFSFFWQAGGNVEMPDEGDSLVLQFLSTNAEWITIWSEEGREGLDETVFTQEIFQVTAEYLHSAFRFQFLSYGDLDGPFDAWHIDWVYLNEGRGADDTVYQDRALTGSLTSPFRPFQAIPINQFDTKYVVNQRVGSSNLDLLIHTNEIGYFLTNTINDQSIISDPLRLYETLSGFEKDTLTLLIGTDNQTNLADVDFSSLQAFDSVVLQTRLEYKSNDATLDGTAVDLRVNDTIRQHYTLHNYFAYDDGTAEFAAGTNVKNAQVAVKFWVEETDTLTHIDINFPQISPIPQTTLTVKLKIMGDLDQDIVLRSQQIDVVDTARNAFKRYALTRPIIVSDTFYVAYQQTLNDYIGIGFDRSNPDASQYIFENREGDWFQNVTLKGALMIRPVFESGIELTLGTKTETAFSIYPNPTKGIFSVSEKYDQIQLLDLSGKVLFEEAQQASHDISNFEQGLYLLKIINGDTRKIQKIILE